MSREEYIKYQLSCIRCHGDGIRLYGSTATWRGGIGGAAMTYGVCNLCWGSGIKDKPWPSHREFEETLKLVGRIKKLVGKIDG